MRLFCFGSSVVEPLPIEDMKKGDGLPSTSQVDSNADNVVSSVDSGGLLDSNPTTGTFSAECAQAASRSHGLDCQTGTSSLVLLPPRVPLAPIQSRNALPAIPPSHSRPLPPVGLAPSAALPKVDTRSPLRELSPHNRHNVRASVHSGGSTSVGAGTGLNQPILRKQLHKPGSADSPSLKPQYVMPAPKTSTQHGLAVGRNASSGDVANSLPLVTAPKEAAASLLVAPLSADSPPCAAVPSSSDQNLPLQPALRRSTASKGTGRRLSWASDHQVFYYEAGQEKPVDNYKANLQAMNEIRRARDREFRPRLSFAELVAELDASEGGHSLGCLAPRKTDPLPGAWQSARSYGSAYGQYGSLNGSHTWGQLMAAKGAATCDETLTTGR